MRIDPSQLDWKRFLEGAPRLVLLYGSDKGLIRFLLEETRDALKETRFLVKFVEEAAFWEDPHGFFQTDLFADAGSVSVVVLQDVSEKNVKRYQALMASGINGNLILTSLKMRAASSLVQEAQKASDQWAVACYPLDLGSKAFWIERKAHQLGLKFSKEALKILAASGDLENFSQTLEKLFLWGTKEITPEVLEACLGEGLFVSETELAYILSGRNQHQLQEWLARAQGDDVLFALRQTVRHFMNMLSVRSALQSQVSLEEALAGLSPPLFFKQLPLFKSHLSQWTLSQLLSSLSLLARSELLFKKRPSDQGYTFPLRQIVQ